MTAAPRRGCLAPGSRERRSLRPHSRHGTIAGSTITNNVTVAYKVGGVTQNAITASDTFTVDRKVHLAIVEEGGATTQVSPGQLAAVTTFIVTNLSNARSISPAATIAGGAGPWRDRQFRRVELQALCRHQQ